MGTLQQNLINHVVFVLDASGSMNGLRHDVIKVYNKQVAELARLSQELDQETRVTVYVFGNQVKCVVYDKDVLRLPKIDTLYHDGGMTSLLDATGQALTELAETAQRYGDHSFLIYVLTDGEENNSRVFGPGSLKNAISLLAENWTLACLVPDVLCRSRALNYGFPSGNVIIWNTTGQGVEEVGEVVAQATNSYMTSRSTGVRGTKTLFSSVVAKSVTQDQVDATGLKPVSPDDFMIIPVALSSSSKLDIKVPSKSKTKKNPDGIKHVEIQPFVEETGRPYVTGNAYYRLTKSEKYFFGKGVALVHRTTRKVYRGPECEKLLGFDPTVTRIRPPQDTDEYEVYVKSTSFNRQVEVGGSILLFR